ncbi:dihydrofolate reductase [Achaetomium macrosporum]|uniref:Dihydrofolate reductase n=1 Tax=Achaetomium macrosporum TaxID=79813 RepID=A0AAN7CA79_9PEZI|nr:dihydrofolate reductase [Achaetomium macrosporum]
MSLEFQAAAPPLPEVTLIVAATARQMGIGRAGALPWPMLKREMAYFARVTRRLAPDGGLNPHTARNAVIMGRKTWESIPDRFRPLPGRWNVVLSRGKEEEGQNPNAVTAQSLEEALTYLGHVKQKEDGLGRVFVIGGAQIYGAALEMKEARRVLLTRVLSKFECDTFFPLKLEEGSPGWRRASQEEMDAWVGEEVPRGLQSEGGTEYEFEMWERVD